MPCGEITKGSSADCAALPAAGTRPRAIAYNYDDLEEPTETDGKISAINLADGKTGFEFVGLESAFKKSEEFARSANTGLGSFKHKCALVLYSRTQEDKDEIVKQFGNGRFCFALFNRGNDADSIEFAGRDVGMRLVPGVIRDQYANDGFFVLNFATPEGEIENENDPMQSIWVTDYEATVAMLEATLPGS